MSSESFYKILVIIVTIWNSCVVGEQYNCVTKDFIRLGNSCYYLSTEIVSWQEAHFRCRDRDAQLAVLGTQHEDSTLRNYLEQPEFAQLGRWIGGFWVGGSDRKWIWAAQGNDIEYLRGFATTSVLELQTEQWMCLYMNPQSRYRWSNENCIRQLHYICEAALVRKKEVSDEVKMTTTPRTTTTQEPYGAVEDLYDDDNDDDDDDDNDDSESSSDT